MMLPTPVIPTAAKEEQGKSSRLPDNGHFLWSSLNLISKTESEDADDEETSY
jgi:hypothetical protein